MDKPLLYLSSFFERNRSVYYDKLSYTREKSDLKQWIKFFLTGIIETADSGTKTLSKIMQIKQDCEKKIVSLNRRSESGYKLLNSLFSSPLTTTKDVQNITGLSPKAAGDLIQSFVNLGILNEITNKKRNRTFAFFSYISLFSD